MTDANIKKMEMSVRDILKEIGEDPDRQGLEKTPYRVAKMYKEITQGYRQSAEELIRLILMSNMMKWSS